MIYRVIVTENAKANLRAYYSHAALQAPLTAQRWLRRFEDALVALSTNPQRCGLAPESEITAMEIRQLLFGKGRSVFRALFMIVDDEVQVLHIRRATRAAANPDEIFG
jgi:plasmid stabilization system protein ParE